MKQFEVEIMGQPYVLSCAEGDDQRFHAAVAQVDGTMNRIREAGKVRARDRIAVLAALNLALELVDLADRPAVAAPIPAPTPVEPDASALADAARLQELLRRLDEALAPQGAEPAAAESEAEASTDGTQAEQAPLAVDAAAPPDAPEAPARESQEVESAEPAVDRIDADAVSQSEGEAASVTPSEDAAAAEGASSEASQDSPRPADALHG